MAVYRHSYQPYDGVVTPAWSRFLILPRYIYQDMFRSKFLTTLLLASFAFPLGCASVIYLHHNLTALKVLEINPARLVAIDSNFFYFYLLIQSGIGFMLTAFVGPGLVSPDLANNALPLYLCRPFSRWEYVLGKMSVLVILLSVITWIPGWLLFLLESSLEGYSWMLSNLRIPFALLVGSFIWIVFLSIFSLTLSAWVKWRFVAGALLFGLMMFTQGMGAAINAIFDSKSGYLINLSEVIKVVWCSLFGVQSNGSMLISDAWRSLLAFCGLCLILLSRKVKAYEVVK
jgi:ABC-2 type transport system permease protein